MIWYLPDHELDVFSVVSPPFDKNNDKFLKKGAIFSPEILSLGHGKASATNNAAQL